MSKDITATSTDLKFGQVSSGNYTTIGDNGIEMFGDATQWDDIRTVPLAGAHSGPRAPLLEVVANDGTSTTGYAVDLDSTELDVSYFSDMNSTTLSFNIWIKPDSVSNSEIIDRDVSGGFEFYMNNGAIYFKPASSSVQTSNNVIVAGQTSMVTVTATAEGSNTRVKIYVNAQLQEEQVVNENLSTSDTTNGWIIGQWQGSSSWTFDGVMDGLYIYNVTLSSSQIVSLYNSGEGTTTHPTGITEATDVIAKFDFNENTGTTADNDCTLGAGYDATWSSGVTWVAGLMGISTGSIGVKALAFPADEVREIFGSIQLPHSYKEGSTIYPHVHWASASTSAGNVVWSIEYLWVNVAASLDANTTISSATAAVDTVTDRKHMMTNIPSAGFTGTGKTISSTIQYRLYRDATNSSDTYTGTAYLSEFDIHFEKDKVGSEAVTTK